MTDAELQLEHERIHAEAEVALRLVMDAEVMEHDLKHAIMRLIISSREMRKALAAREKLDSLDLINGFEWDAIIKIMQERAL